MSPHQKTHVNKPAMWTWGGAGGPIMQKEGRGLASPISVQTQLALGSILEKGIFESLPFILNHDFASS